MYKARGKKMEGHSIVHVQEKVRGRWWGQLAGNSKTRRELREAPRRELKLFSFQWRGEKNKGRKTT